MPKKSLRLLAACLSLLLLFTACSFTFPWERRSNRTSGGWGILTQSRRLVNFDEIEYSRPDLDALIAVTEECVAAMENAEDFNAFSDATWIGDEEWETFNTMYTYAQLRTYLDTTDTFFNEELRWFEDAAAELTPYSLALTRALVEGPFAKQLRSEWGDYYFEQMELSLLLDSEEVSEYKKERANLEIDYNEMLATLSVEYEGKSYTMEDIYEEESIVKIMFLYTEIFRQNAPAFAEVYARMIELDRLTAATLGFDSPAEMYYLSYHRDYTPEDAWQLIHASREIFVPLTENVFGTYYSTTPELLDNVVDTLPGLLGKVDSQLVNAWGDMIEYDLYSFEAKPEKMSGIAFTTYLTGYDAPYVYTYWGDTSGSVTTIIHEFGHFYDNWLHYDSSSWQNLDIAEIYSQSLEVLMYPYYGDLMQDGEAGKLENLGDLLDAMTYQSLLEEFQLRAYELEVVDASTLAELYSELLDAYGYGGWGITGDDGLDHSWFTVTHLFNVPFYTISYTTSAAVALQLWSVSEEDHGEAINIYMNMINADQNVPFDTLVTEAGLESVFERATLLTIAEDLEDLFTIRGKQRAA